MARPDRYFDWHQVREYTSRVEMAADGQLRLRVILLAFFVLLFAILGRLLQLEYSYGAAYRETASKPQERRIVLPAPRGRILARDGSVLAVDEPCMALAVHYRYLQQPPDPGWLRSIARRRLSRDARRDAGQVSRKQDEVRVELAELHRRLARMCGLSQTGWEARTHRIQRRVESIAESVNARHQQARSEAAQVSEPQTVNLPSWLSGGRVERWINQLSRSVPAVSTARITVAEELDFHVVADQVPLDVVVEIESNPVKYQGVRLVPQRRRRYPSTTLAAHVVGHVATATEEDRAALEQTGSPEVEEDLQVGRLGIERQYESLLRGKPGLQTEWTDSSGTVLEVRGKSEAVPGRDLVLTLDPTLQRTCESLLAAALRRRRINNSERYAAGGGAIVVLDVRTGEVLALASAPTFDPNAFVDGGNGAASYLSDENAPLLSRSVQMALPPGSVFKVISSAALLEEGVIDAARPFFCQGYLDRPDRERCQIYIHRGVGHGETTLSDALVRSCNVYYFHHATDLNPGSLAEWARRFGLGAKTHIDLPYEAAGQVPTFDADADPAPSKHQQLAKTRALVIGQSTLTTTPLQMARAIAAVANDGQLVTPRLIRSFGPSHIEDDANQDQLDSTPAASRVEGLDASIADTLRRAMRQVVADREGTAHATVDFDAVSIAGKTGTAQAGGNSEDHAWFVGYAPHERPKVAFAVALEHAGSGSLAAGPVARRVVEQLHRLGYFDPPGKRIRVAREMNRDSSR